MSAKSWLRSGAAAVLFYSGITAPERRARRKLSIATFHRVLPEAQRRAYPFPGLAVTPQELDAFLAFFNHHFDCGPLSVQHERHLRREKSAKPLLAVTFDDGQHDNFLHARPVLARHGIGASFFIPVEAVERRALLWHDRLGFAVQSLLERREGAARLERLLGAAGLTASGDGSAARSVARDSKRLSAGARLRLVDELVHAAGTDRTPEYARLMTYEEIVQLSADGHEIGSHGMSHRMLPDCDESSIRYEVSESRRRLRERVGQPVDSFCYPNGDSDSRSAAAVGAAGYRRAVTTDWGANDTDADAFRLRRFDMVAQHAADSKGAIAPAVVAFRMSGWYPGLR
jgi:peptidoglycan/xylan/chitin deacetylase (PgdA/CDA1 family)